MNVNPAHLRLLSQRDNAARRSEMATCARGHERTPDNIQYDAKRGVKHCLACRRLRYHANKAVSA